MMNTVDGEDDYDDEDDDFEDGVDDFEDKHHYQDRLITDDILILKSLAGQR